MDKALLKLQIFLHGLGANKDFCIWDMLGNAIQDIRNFLGVRS
jgi:hypothetical protein